MTNFLQWSQIFERHNDIWASVVLWNNWGDEWKWKITDSLAEYSDIIIRFQWWHNAWHTVKVWDKSYDLHILPSGMVSEWKINLITSGCVLWIELPKIYADKVALKPNCPIVPYSIHELVKSWVQVWLIPELKKLSKGWINLKKSWLHISLETPVIGLHNVILDAFDEQARIASWLRPIGSTWSGISRAYASISQRYHFSLSDLLYNPENYYNSIKALWMNYSNIFPRISIDDLIHHAKHEREEVIKYIQTWIITLVENEKEFIKTHFEQWKIILWEWAQSALIWSNNSIYGTASSPWVESFINATWLKAKNIGNAFLVNKFPPSSVWMRPKFLQYFNSSELENFINNYREFWVSTWRKRDIFMLSLPEICHSTQLNVSWLLDDERIVPVVNRMDALNDVFRISNNQLPVVLWYNYTKPTLDTRMKDIVQVWIWWEEKIHPENLSQNYPLRSQQDFLFHLSPKSLHIRYLTQEKATDILWIYTASMSVSDLEREVILGTGPERHDLQLKKVSPVRYI